MSIYDFIKEKEGYRENAYDDGTGVWTVGYGRTGRDINPGSSTTEAAADEWLKNRVDSDRAYVKAYGEKYGYNWNDNQLDSLSSFVYNLGRGSLDQLTDSGNRDNSTIGAKIPLYNKAGGKVLPGLVTRRNEEAAIFTGEPGGVPERTFPGPHAKVPEVRGERTPPKESFGEAFAAARKAQGSEGYFDWNGQQYTTKYKEELNNGGEVMGSNWLHNLFSTKPNPSPGMFNEGGNVDIEDPTNRDTIPAMLTKGEFVLNKEAVSLFGPQIEQMNQAGLELRQKENQAHLNAGGVPMLNKGGMIPQGYNRGGLTADQMAKAKLEEDLENAWFKKNERKDLYDFNKSIRDLDKMEQRPEPIINENPVPHQKWLSPYMEPRLDPVFGNTSVPPGTPQMSDEEAAAFNAFVSQSLPKPLEERYAAARRAWNDNPSRENKAAFEAVKKERDAFIAQRKSVGVREDTPVGSLTDTSVHSAIGGRPDEVPVGDLAAGNASMVPVDPRTKTLVGSLTDTSLHPQKEGETKTWTAPDGREYYIENGIVVGNVNPEHGQYMPLNIQEQYKNANTAGGAEMVVNEITNKANLEAEQNNGVVSEETKTELEEAKTRAKELRTHEDRIREERAAVAREYEDKQRAEYERLKADNDVLGIVTPPFDIWRKGKEDPEDIAKVVVPTETAVVEGTGLESAYDEAGLNVPPMKDKKVPEVVDNTTPHTEEETVSTNKDGTVTVKTPTGTTEYTPDQVKGVEGFLGDFLGGLGFDNIDFGSLVGEYLLARALGQTHAQAGAGILSSIRDQKAAAAADVKEAKDARTVVSSEAGSVTYREGTSGKTLNIATRTQKMGDGSTQTQYRYEGEWYSENDLNEILADKGYTIDKLRDSDTDAATDRLWASAEDDLTKELKVEFEGVDGVNYESYAREASAYAREHLNIKKPADSREFHTVTMSAARMMQRDIDAGKDPQSILPYLEMARADAYAGQSNSVWILNPGDKVDDWEFVESEHIAGGIVTPIAKLAKVNATKANDGKEPTQSQIYNEERKIHERLYNAWNSTEGKKKIKEKYGDPPKGHNTFSWFATQILADSAISDEEKKLYNIK